MNVYLNFSLFRHFKLTRDCGAGNSLYVLILHLLLVALFHIPCQAAASTIKVTWDPSRVKRGSVVTLKVQSPVKLMAAEAATGRDSFPLLRTGEGEYVALVGVDAKIKQTSIPVDFTLFPVQGGSPYRIRADLKIRDRVPGTPKVQKLSLPSGMVDLSQQRLDEVRQDNRTLGDVLGTRSRVRYWKKGFLMPVEGRITTRFGTRRVLNGKPRSPHSGVDIAGKKGTPVKSSNSGKVVLNTGFYLSGNTVVLDHGWGLSTVYAHMNRVHVREGQEVQRGEILGTVGSTGRATGPHLHFGAFIRGAKVDPLKLIEATEAMSTRYPLPSTR